MLILAFIFLTPKSWFASNPPVQPPVQTTVVLSSDLIGNQSDNAEIDRVARAKLKLPSGQVMVRLPKYDSSGKLIAYEVDIR